MSDTTSLLEDAAKGAAMGLPFGGPIGAALGGVGGVVAHFAPSLLSDLFGSSPDQAVKIATAAAGVVQTVCGTTDPTKAFAAAGDPAIETQLRVQLAQISAGVRRDELAAQAAQISAAVQQLQAQLSDVADARKQTTALAANGSRMAWGAPMVSVVVLVTFGFVVAMALTRVMPPGSEAILNVLLGTLGSMSMAVVGYWVGNTHMATAMANSAAEGVPVAFASKLLPAPVAAIAAPLEAAARPFLQGKGL